MWNRRTLTGPVVTAPEPEDQVPARSVMLSEALCWADAAGRLARAATVKPVQRQVLRLRDVDLFRLARCFLSVEGPAMGVGVLGNMILLQELWRVRLIQVGGAARRQDWRRSRMCLQSSSRLKYNLQRSRCVSQAEKGRGRLWAVGRDS